MRVYGVRCERAEIYDEPYMNSLLTSDIEEAKGLAKFINNNYPKREAKVVVIKEVK